MGVGSVPEVRWEGGRERGAPFAMGCHAVDGLGREWKDGEWAGVVVASLISTASC